MKIELNMIKESNPVDWAVGMNDEEMAEVMEELERQMAISRKKGYRLVLPNRKQKGE